MKCWNRRRFLRHVARAGASAAGLMPVSGCEALPFVSRRAAVARLGWLKLDSNDIGSEKRAAAFSQGLAERGWMEGRNLSIDFRTADGVPERLPDLAAELARLPLDVILAERTPATLAIKRVSSTLPIVMVGVGSPVENGVVASLARPGGNVTGLSLVNLTSKHLQLLKELVPGLSRVALLLGVGNPANRGTIENAAVAARSLDLDLRELDVRLAADLESAFTFARAWPAEALYVHLETIPDLLFNEQVAAFAARNHLPTLSEFRFGPEAGGLLSYGVDLPPLYRRAATFVDKILRGTKPADLPVEQPTTYEFVVNSQTLQALALTLPFEVAAQVTEWL